MRNAVEMRDQPVAVHGHFTRNGSVTAFIRLVQTPVAQLDEESRDQTHRQNDSAPRNAPVHFGSSAIFGSGKRRRRHHHSPIMSSAGRHSMTNSP